MSGKSRRRRSDIAVDPRMGLDAVGLVGDVGDGGERATPICELCILGVAELEARGGR